MELMAGRRGTGKQKQCWRPHTKDTLGMKLYVAEELVNDQELFWWAMLKVTLCKGLATLRYKDHYTLIPSMLLSSELSGECKILVLIVYYHHVEVLGLLLSHSMHSLWFSADATTVLTLVDLPFVSQTRFSPGCSRWRWRVSLVIINPWAWHVIPSTSCVLPH